MSFQVRKTAAAIQNGRPRLSPKFRLLGPPITAPNGMFDVLAANVSQALPILRLRLASMENVPKNATARNVPKKITEARSPLAAV